VLNIWIKSYAAEHGYVHVDFYPAMVDAWAGCRRLSKDGVHPLPAGYAVMKPPIEAGMANALAGK